MKKRIVWTILFIGLFIWIFTDNYRLAVSQYSVALTDLPEAFVGYKIVQLSDVHDSLFGKHQKRLVELVKKEKPDAIFLTGDFVDRQQKEFSSNFDLVKGIKEIAPVYYVEGNHERTSPYEAEVLERLAKEGVIILQNDAKEINRGNQRIIISGVRDPFDHDMGMERKTIEEEVRQAVGKWSVKDCVIMLSHRPEYFDIYQQNEVDLVFSGHAHGGQIRIPFVGALVAPNQGIFPKLTEGVITKSKTSLVISRGLGNSVLKLRLFNTPEIVSVTLTKK